VLALPNDLAAPYVKALDAAGSKAKVVDLSADYRFDPTWAYGFPEHRGYRERIAAATRVSNPGCYATGAQAALLPLDGLIDTSYPQLCLASVLQRRWDDAVTQERSGRAEGQLDALLAAQSHAREGSVASTPRIPSLRHPLHATRRTLVPRHRPHHAVQLRKE